MIDRSRFDHIRNSHGAYASWAVWAPAGSSPKSNIANLDVLDPVANPSLLSTLHADAVMVGLNISRPLSEAFRNFHDPRPHAQDFKIRYAFDFTRWWGAYMTDIIKYVETIKTSELRSLLTPEVVRQNVDSFVNELRDLGSTKPVLLAFGRDTYKIVVNHVPSSAYTALVALTHYSHQISKESYRTTVLRQIAEAPALAPLARPEREQSEEHDQSSEA
ncbi:MAG: hypothetical protein M3Q09_12065 [Gemmatimonadota bacterium]|nr:hypothetical protein [Gemmatimonadota bacterium]